MLVRGLLAKNPVAVEADFGLVDQRRAEDVGLAQHGVPRRDAAVDGGEIVNGNGRKVEVETAQRVPNSLSLLPMLWSPRAKSWLMLLIC